MRGEEKESERERDTHRQKRTLRGGAAENMYNTSVRKFVVRYNLLFMF